MKTFVPGFYKDFTCIAGECRNSCCIGWEIDIDPITLKKYNKMSGETGKKIRENICFQDDTAFFRLEKNEKCPFLNKDNLCDIILDAGEGFLCDICRDHPRFRNFYSDRIEMGLGLCCEEAARIILDDKEPFSLVPLDGKTENLSFEEILFIEERDLLIKTVESEKDVFAAIEKINGIYELKSIEFEVNLLADFLLSLERLNRAWTDKLNLLKSSRLSDKQTVRSENAFKNLYKYFLFRHLTDEGFYENLAFAEFSTKVIFEICGRTGFSFRNICEVARMYSSEIEYSDENKDRIIEFAGE